MFGIRKTVKSVVKSVLGIHENPHTNSALGSTRFESGTDNARTASKHRWDN